MQIQKIVALGALAALSSGAMAGGFDGPYFQMGMGVANTKVKVADSQFSGSDTNFSNTSAIGLIGGGYSKSFGQFNLAGSAYWNFSEYKANSNTLKDGADTGTLRYKGSSNFGFTIEPGWNLSAAALVYAKLGYTQTQGSVTVDYNIAGLEGTTNEKHTLRGYSFGFGGKYLIAPKVFVALDVLQSNFSKKSYFDSSISVDPSYRSAVLSIGGMF